MKYIELEFNIKELTYIIDGINALMCYYTGDTATYYYLFSLKNRLKKEREKCTQSD